MIGNDVVDLADAEAQDAALHPRFDQRVFATGERRRIAATGPGAPLRWILWAAKEGAYKVARRLDAATCFAPARFVVELDADLVGHVRHGDVAYPVRVTATRGCVHAVATAPGLAIERVASGVRRLADAGDSAVPGRAARTFAILEIASRLDADGRSLTIRSRERIPELRLGSRDVGVDLSLSHHGRFVAYACALPAADREAAR